MKYLYLLFTIFAFFGCAHCASSDPPPNIRQMPGSECCPAYCEKVTMMVCTGYYETLPVTLPDGGVQNMNCNEFCQFMLSNSIPLNPCCLKDNLKSCNEIENICQ